MSDPNRAVVIRQSIEDAYGSLSDPNYRFVEPAYNRLRRHDAVLDLMQACFVKDETDLNDHVALHLHILHSEGAALVWLPCIRPWALFVRIGHAPIGTVLTAASELSRPEHEIVQIVERQGFKLLIPREAATPLHMQLSTTNPDEAMFFHALFSDDGVVPQMLSEYRD